jgi:hypothetical protein
MKNLNVLFALVFLSTPVTFLFSQETHEDAYAKAREYMVMQQLAARDITSVEVLEAMGKVPRHLFVSPRYRSLAYADRPLPIDEGQTISQPYIVALMTQYLRLQPEDKVLEIGTGSGYQAAVLTHFTDNVYSIEIRELRSSQGQMGRWLFWLEGICPFRCYNRDLCCQPCSSSTFRAAKGRGAIDYSCGEYPVLPDFNPHNQKGRQTERQAHFRCHFRSDDRQSPGKKARLDSR